MAPSRTRQGSVKPSKAICVVGALVVLGATSGGVASAARGEHGRGVLRTHVDLRTAHDARHGDGFGRSHGEAFAHSHGDRRNGDRSNGERHDGNRRGGDRGAGARGHTDHANHPPDHGGPPPGHNTGFPGDGGRGHDHPAGGPPERSRSPHGRCGGPCDNGKEKSTGPGTSHTPSTRPPSVPPALRTTPHIPSSQNFSSSDTGLTSAPLSGAGSPLELLETPANRLPALSASLQSSLTRQLEAGSLGGAAAGNGGAASLLQGAGGARTPQQQRASGGSGGVFVPTSAGNAATITHLVERVIPDAIWILLAIAVGLAVGSGAAAYRSSRRARLQAGQFAAISAAALTDPLTGVLNRRGFSEAVERELARARRYDRSFVMAYVDVRGLKAVNDTEGHLVGDQLLRSVADLLKQSARADDVVGRIGGDELALLLAEQTAEGAAVVARRIRGEVDTKRRAMNLRASWDLTLGTATFPEDGQSFEELLAAADRRMYEQRGIQLR